MKQYIFSTFRARSHFLVDGVALLVCGQDDQLHRAAVNVDTRVDPAGVAQVVSFSTNPFFEEAVAWRILLQLAA